MAVTSLSGSIELSEYLIGFPERGPLSTARWRYARPCLILVIAALCQKLPPVGKRGVLFGRPMTLASVKAAAGQAVACFEIVNQLRRQIVDHIRILVGNVRQLPRVFFQVVELRLVFFLVALGVDDLAEVPFDGSDRADPTIPLD